MAVLIDGAVCLSHSFYVARCCCVDSLFAFLLDVNRGCSIVACVARCCYMFVSFLLVCSLLLFSLFCFVVLRVILLCSVCFWGLILLEAVLYCLCCSMLLYVCLIPSMLLDVAVLFVCLNLPYVGNAALLSENVI